MLLIDNLSVSYGKTVVLSNLSISFESGKIHGIIGYNGAGKTTLLNAIYGIPKHYDNITLSGEVITRKKISFLETDLFYYPRITGNDYLNLFRDKNPCFEFESLGDVFNVPLNNFVDSYSTGMKKKLSIIGILSMGKEVILLDEPFNGLDIESVSILQIALRKLANAGHTIIITSHIMESLSSLSDSISLLKDGSISKTYLPDEYKALEFNIKDHIELEYGKTLNAIFQ